jgi:hypothetical protein
MATVASRGETATGNPVTEREVAGRQGAQP